MTGNKRPTIIPGLVLIVVAVIMLFSHFGAFRLDWGNLWAYVILVIGILFWIAFVFDRAKSGLIMPGTVLITVGVVFVLNEAGYADIGSTWPFFILAPAFGFYMMYLVGNRERGNLVPATILTIIGVIFLIEALGAVLYVAIALIIIGGLLLYRAVREGGGGPGSGGGRRGEGPDEP